MENVKRARRAGKALKAYKDALGDKNAEIETVITDILTDIMHLSDRSGIDFNHYLNTAYRHHEAEQTEG